MKINILIADNHPPFLMRLEELIESEARYGVIFSAKNGIDVLAIVVSEHPMVVILDIDMMGMNGLFTAQELIKIAPDTNIILMVTHKAKNIFLRAIEIGISGYVLKENAVVDIIPAIDAVVKGGFFISPEIGLLLDHQQGGNNGCLPIG